MWKVWLLFKQGCSSPRDIEMWALFSPLINIKSQADMWYRNLFTPGISSVLNVSPVTTCNWILWQGSLSLFCFFSFFFLSPSEVVRSYIWLNLLNQHLNKLCQYISAVSICNKYKILCDSFTHSFTKKQEIENTIFRWVQQENKLKKKTHESININDFKD